MSKSSVFQSVSVTESDLPNVLTEIQNSKTDAANSAAAAATSAASVATAASNAATEASNAGNEATAAANSATAAAGSASAAATSETNASAHVTSAGNHVSSAANSATSATNSQAAATQAATNAASSETAAATSATAAATSATAAASSATAAQTSVTNAQAEVTNAQAEVTNAQAEVANAQAEVTNAQTEVTNAANQATAASNSASAAANSASAASTSETNAQTHANTASGHTTSASTQATNAATSATNAATSETNAGTQATAAASSAANSAASATASAGSATNAATAQTAAESARDSALAAFDSFDDRYLGSKTSDPSTDNDGNTLVAGTLYFNSSTSTMMLYTGSAWVAAYVSGGSFAALSGATFTGDVTVPNLVTAGNVDGRDVSADGTKLDGIAANATSVSSLTDLSISDGTSGQALKTDGAGNFSFGDVSGSITSSDVTTALGFTPISSVAFSDITSKPTTLSGYGITSGFVAQLGDATSPDYQTASSRRVDPNSANPTNEHYAINTFGNGGNVTGQIAAHFQTGQLYSRGYNSSFSSWRKIWNDANDGSGSGLDADLLDGYHASTTRNSANTIPIRNSSGYLDLGWINTTSGATTSTISRIYASQDAYIRYVTPATFRDQIISGQTITDIYNNGWFRSNGTKGWYNQTYGGGINMEDSTYVRTYGSKQFYVNNHIKTSHNVTAYFSDERLKTKTGDIDNALDKVQSLSGFTYVENELAKELGYNSDAEQVGVSAQQVQAVCPQAVHLAPVDEKVEDDGTIVSKSGENYVTVDYPRLVPLLIEAIKELKAEVEDLKAGCCHGSAK